MSEFEIAVLVVAAFVVGFAAGRVWGLQQSHQLSWLKSAALANRTT